MAKIVSRSASKQMLSFPAAPVSHRFSLTFLCPKLSCYCYRKRWQSVTRDVKRRGDLGAKIHVSWWEQKSWCSGGRRLQGAASRRG